MNFLLGVAVGAVGYWAYRSGKLQSLTGAAPEPFQQAVNMASERVNQVASSDQVRSVTSSVQERVQSAKLPDIAMPSIGDITGRPAEPRPGQEPEGTSPQS